MLKKMFYTVLALGAVLTIGIATSSFISAGTATAAKTAVKAETPFVDTWIGGWVGYDGTRKRGTGSWTVEKFDKGRYFIKPASGTVVNITATLMVDNGETKYICVTGYTKDGYGYVYIYDPTDNIFGSGTDGDFSFVASVEQ
jgi:hypothetical protein